MNALNHSETSILVIGIGNIGRGDDGLGWKMADAVQDRGFKNVTVENRYQLQVEDALLVSGYQLVIFVDASHIPLPGGFSWQSCQPGDHYFYSSHLQSPETVLYLAGTLYSKIPEAYLLAIEGKHWDLGDPLSAQADRSFQNAAKFLFHQLKNRIGRFPDPEPATIAQA